MFKFFSSLYVIVFTATLIVTLQASAQPTISSFSPENGPLGTIVTITGTNFNATSSNNIVYFGAVRGTVTSGTTSALTVIVPAGANFQPISVVDIGTRLSAYSAKPFITTFANPFAIGIPNNFYRPKVFFATPPSVQCVQISDIDVDGKPDIAIVNQTTGSVSIMRNTYTSGLIDASSFGSNVHFSFGLSPYFVAIADLDGDAKPDLAVADNYYSMVSVRRNISTPGAIDPTSFAPPVNFQTGVGARAVAIGDIDGDGRPDLVVANNNDHTISILRNTSISTGFTASSFATKIDFATGLNPYSIAIGDLDGDNKPDLTIANNGSNTVSVFRNTSISGAINGTSFAAKVDFTAGILPTAVSIVDIDGNGKPEIVVTNATSNTISVLQNNSSSGNITATSFTTKIDFAVVDNPYALATGDLDGDGKPDLGIANYSISANLSVLNNTSTIGSISASSFASKVDFTAENGPRSLAIGDVTGDGIPEIVVSNNAANSLSVFQIGSPSVLPITFEWFQGHKQGTGNLISWKITKASSGNQTLERSHNARDFDDIYTITAAMQGSLQLFNYTDLKPSQGTNYYRLKLVDMGGNVSYSNIIAILNKQEGFEIVNITPNPVTSGIFQLNITSAQEQKIDVIITDINGRLVEKSKVSLSVGFNSIKMQVARLTAGTYHLYGHNKDGNSKSLKIIVK